MQLYTGVSSEFITGTASNAITDRLVTNFERYFRYRPPDSGVRSWQNSLSRFARVLDLVAESNAKVDRNEQRFPG
jgi:hypothetical protein